MADTSGSTKEKEAAEVDKKLDLAIFDLESAIDRIILERDDDLPDKVKQLRQRIFYVHSLTESSLDLMIGYKLYLQAKPSSNNPPKVVFDFIDSTISITTQLNFPRKVKIAKEMGIIDEGFSKLGNKLNDVRNDLAHVKNFKKIYSEKSEQEKALKLALDTLTTLEEIKKRPLPRD